VVGSRSLSLTGVGGRGRQTCEKEQRMGSVVRDEGFVGTECDSSRDLSPGLVCASGKCDGVGGGCCSVCCCDGSRRRKRRRLGNLPVFTHKIPGSKILGATFLGAKT
jgi:hypothetical protein